MKATQFVRATVIAVLFFLVALVLLGCPSRVELYTDMLWFREPFVRKLGVEGLGTLGDARAVEPLVVGLWDWDPDVRRAAAAALAELGNVAVASL
ncbi:MAG: HEAT repeat domain-containing protein, partial [candidate division KSB1 bacterium]|nr:HEAT repeat domain-containing protein [candidate division KSB1 bacterium]